MRVANNHRHDFLADVGWNVVNSDDVRMLKSRDLPPRAPHVELVLVDSIDSRAINKQSGIMELSKYAIAQTLSSIS